MEPLIGLAVFAVLLVAIIESVKHFKGGLSTQLIEGAYRKRESVMNKSEQAFFYELQKQLPAEYHIFPNMRIADILEAIDGKGFYNRRNKILPKHVDFLICDRYFKPVVAIEVNGSSHRRRDRITRDEQVKQIFADAGLPLEWVDVGSNFAESIGRIKASARV